MNTQISLTVNGRRRDDTVPDNLLLVDYLRESLGLNGTKIGCDGGECGCCTVLVKGKPLLSCVIPAQKVDGKEVVTNEGLPDEVREQVSECFVRAGAVQCGFCIPGMLIAATVLPYFVVPCLYVIIKRPPKPAEEQELGWT